MAGARRKASRVRTRPSADAADRDARTARNPSGTGSVAACVRRCCSSFGSTWVCGPSGLLPPGRDRLIDLGAADPADEDAVRVRRKNDPHRRIGRIEHRPPDALAQFRRDRRIGDADARSACSTSSPRSNRIAPRSLLPQRRVVRPDFREHLPPVHRAVLLGKAQGDAVSSSRAGRCSPRRTAVSLRRRNADAAARASRPTGSIAEIDRGILVAVARELGDAAESAEAPLRVGIFKVLRDERCRLAIACPSLHSLLLRRRPGQHVARAVMLAAHDVDAERRRDIGVRQHRAGSPAASTLPLIEQN